MNEKARKFAREWSKKWFGFWGREEQLTKEKFSLENHTDSTWMPDDRAKIIAYLNNTPVAIVAQTADVECGLCDEIVYDSCYRYDGEWLWPDSLAHLVEKHFFILPDLFVNHIRKNKYKCPDFPPVSIGDLPWPT